VGKTGTGKSSTGNSILQNDEFEKDLSSSPVTNVCKKVESKFNDIAVIDTPGIFDTQKNIDHESYRQMKELCHPGPHAVVIVFRAIALSETDLEPLEAIKNKFGDRLTDHAIILFTHKDQLDQENTTLESFLSGAGKTTKRLNQFIFKCNNRILAFDNVSKPEEQVECLLKMIKTNIAQREEEYMTLK
jgi:predicted GTPase